MSEIFFLIFRSNYLLFSWKPFIFGIIIKYVIILTPYSMIILLNTHTNHYSQEVSFTLHWKLQYGEILNE